MKALQRTLLILILVSFCVSCSDNLYTMIGFVKTETKNISTVIDTIFKEEHINENKLAENFVTQLKSYLDIEEEISIYKILNLKEGDNVKIILPSLSKEEKDNIKASFASAVSSPKEREILLDKLSQELEGEEKERCQNSVLFLSSMLGYIKIYYTENELINGVIDSLATSLVATVDSTFTKGDAFVIKVITNFLVDAVGIIGDYPENLFQSPGAQELIDGLVFVVSVVNETNNTSTLDFSSLSYSNLINSFI